jgi:hypothetical protein
MDHKGVPHIPRGSIARVDERCPPLVYGAKLRGDKKPATFMAKDA